MNRSNLMIDIEAILEGTKFPLIGGRCIYKVPYDIREVNADAYTPKCISIGPLHHFDKRLQKMEAHKRIYFKQFVARCKNNLNDLVSAVKDEEPRLRRCYSENLEISPDVLVKVILVDACFIVEVFYKIHSHDWTAQDERMSREVGIKDIDFVLLENQVPFFILEKLYNIALSSHNLAPDSQHRKPPSFLKVSIEYFSRHNTQELKPDFTICHFTDLFRTFYLKKPNQNRNHLPFDHIPTASAFNEAGGKFKKNESECKLDLQFSEGCLEIPHIILEDITEALFRNMLAFEICHYPRDGYISDYIYLMDLLINTEKDVDLLVENGILFNWLGNNEAAAKLFNSLTTLIEFDGKSQYTDVINELNNFYNNPWRQKWATLKRDYCDTPWHALATCAAIIILVLTLIQTICSILQVV